ncbi:DUF3667 domain-containing protein [Flavobacterium sp.]|uniref:DUF3667 domain-containing protein n=1 Tax=Flavobacterium sp. TaxID=239 RepID=UPI002B4B7AB2|nr:DUF3667 domain-containing protein [Flavobacterium sp.]HLP64773.1 DUF3667 domain-containing protein [Flavobacterium sp.]
MSHKNPIRKDKTCLNCNHVVDQRFCPNCGQENTDTRKTFYHLFVHFFEDLTHYENAFWKTIKNLLLKPASLTKEYLSGKRLSYLAPVRLYIFISFVTFFMIAVLPDEDESDDVIKINEKKDEPVKSEKNLSYNYADSIKKEVKEEIQQQDSISTDTLSKEAMRIEELKKKGVLKPSEADSIKKLIQLGKKEETAKKNYSLFSSEYESIAQLDSVRKSKPNEMNDVEYWFEKKSIGLKEKYTEEQLKEKFLESIKHNFPKTLFIYMPIFALVLWFFHDKKRWYYFDHGIFTLHYFSFLLLITLIMLLLDTLFSLIGDSWFWITMEFFINFIGTIWMLYYFFPAHHRFYGETRMVSFIKSVFIFIINSILFSIVLTLFLIYTFANL